VLRAEMPHAWAAFRAGRTSEWRMTIVARESACLSRDHRRLVDERLALDADRLEAMGDRELGDAVRRLAYQLDPEAWVSRRRIAETLLRFSRIRLGRVFRSSSRSGMAACSFLRSPSSAGAPM